MNDLEELWCNEKGNRSLIKRSKPLLIGLYHEIGYLQGRSRSQSTLIVADLNDIDYALY